jgi:crotonobetainyl-CoA:carnitine CoA-transferase CaiB-like acyl-CoA transferase
MLIDAEYEICVQQMRRAIVSAQQGTPPQRLGNADPDVLHQDVYPARGEDRWVAISVFDAAQRARLAEMAGGRSLADWTRDQEECVLVDRLQAAGIAAGVLNIEDLMEHDAPRARETGGAAASTRPLVMCALNYVLASATPYRAPALGETPRSLQCRGTR